MIEFKKIIIAAFLSFVFFGINNNAVAKSFTLKLISYNILEGMKLDTTSGKSAFVDWVKEKNPDILAIQEANNFTQSSLEELAHKYGHPYAILVKEKGYPTALTSKFPIVNISKVTDNMTHGFIKAQIKGINIIVLHLNPHNYLKRREEIEVILETIRSSNQKKWMIMGDFNSLSPLDSLRYVDGKLLQRSLENAKVNPKILGLIDGKQLDYLVQQKILDYGLVDAFKLMNPKNLNYNRIDYIYLSKDMQDKVTRTEFIHDNFTNHYSDHRPLILEINLP